MGRFFRRVLNGVTLASVVLCVVAAAMWVRAASWTDVAGWGGWRNEKARVWHGCGVISARGAFEVYCFAGSWNFYDPSNVSQADSAYATKARFFHRGRSATNPSKGFRWEKIVVPGVTNLYLASVPHWVVVMGFAPMPVWRGVLIVRRRRQERQVGMCKRCGYDLRATPERCPECGTSPALVVAGL